MKEIWFLVLTLSTGWASTIDDYAMKQFVTINMPDEQTCLKMLNMHVYTDSRQRADEFQDEIIVPHRVENKTCKSFEVDEMGYLAK